MPGVPSPLRLVTANVLMTVRMNVNRLFAIPTLPRQAKKAKPAPQPEAPAVPAAAAPGAEPAGAAQAPVPAPAV